VKKLEFFEKIWKAEKVVLNEMLLKAKSKYKIFSKKVKETKDDIKILNTNFESMMEKNP
jgi:hypothetical protein